MNFSELFKQTGQLCKFSPDGQYLANVAQYRLIVRDAKTLQILQLYTCLDAIQQFEWSSDSLFILCGMFKRSLVQVWSMEQPEWTCKIDEGSAGLVDVRWSPDGRHILTVADFHLRITIWSLINKSVSYIKYPKPCVKGIDFSEGGKYLALVERRDCKDYVSVFACDVWQLVKHFEIDTEDAAGVEWSPDARVLAVWESCLIYKILIYSADGRCLSSYSAYQVALGIKSLAWSATGQFLAVGSYDQKVRLLNHLTWKTIVELNHPTVQSSKSSVVIYEESSQKLPQSKALNDTNNANNASVVLCSAPSKYEVVASTTVIPSVKPDVEKANPKIGVGAVAFSTNCRYMYTRNDNMPTALWIWDIQRLSLSAILLQESPIRCVEWDSGQSRLALCTGNNKVYIWSPAGCLSVEVPNQASFTVQSLKWHCSGHSLLLIGRDQMCVCFLAKPDGDL